MSLNTSRMVSAFISRWSLLALLDFASLGGIGHSLRSSMAIDRGLLHIIDGRFPIII